MLSALFWFIALILMGIGFAVIVYLIYVKNLYQRENQIDCGNSVISQALAYNDYLDLGNDSQIVQCFCYQKFKLSRDPIKMY